MEVNILVCIFVVDKRDKPRLINKIKFSKMKNINQKTQILKGKVDTMGYLKTQFSKRSNGMFKEYKEQVSKGIQELREMGCKEDTHPLFNNLVNSFNYWA